MVFSTLKTFLRSFDDFAEFSDTGHHGGTLLKRRLCHIGDDAGELFCALGGPQKISEGSLSLSMSVRSGALGPISFSCQARHQALLDACDLPMGYAVTYVEKIPEQKKNGNVSRLYQESLSHDIFPVYGFHSHSDRRKQL